MIIVAIGLGLLRAITPAPGHTVAPPEDYERWKKGAVEWGRWGKDDQIGALNLITPAKRKQLLADL
jgi:hypothetical protein